MSKSLIDKARTESWEMFFNGILSIFPTVPSSRPFRMNRSVKVTASISDSWTKTGAYIRNAIANELR